MHVGVCLEFGEMQVLIQTGFWRCCCTRVGPLHRKAHSHSPLQPHPKFSITTTTTTPTISQRNTPTTPNMAAPKVFPLRTLPLRPISSYAHLELITPSSPSPPALDTLQAHSYCLAALTRFLGDTGAAVPVDVLKVEGPRCWVRVPAEDLPAFAAAVTAWGGTKDDGVDVLFRILGCSDWLGCLVGGEGQEELWTS